jgi:DNA-binding transcriptional LysR family regulator
MLNTLYIRTFLAVVDAGNYTAAAEQLHMSQPAISQHIRALEEYLGNVRLFRRVGQRMVPTHAGEELLATARELMILTDRTVQNIRALRGQVAGQVTIGCTASSGEHLLPPLLAAFHQRFPAVSLRIQIAPGDMLPEALGTQQVTFLLIEEFQRRRGWEYHLLGHERLELLAPEGHALVQQGGVPPRTLRDHPMILPYPGSALRRTIEEGLRRRGLAASDLQITLECDSVAAILQSVRHGLGLAFVPTTHLQPSHGLQSIVLDGVPLQQEWYILRERSRDMPHAAQELFTFLTSPVAQNILQQSGLTPADKL